MYYLYSLNSNVLIFLNIAQEQHNHSQTYPQNKVLSEDLIALKLDTRNHIRNF